MAARKALDPKLRETIAHNATAIAPQLVERAATYVLAEDIDDKLHVQSALLRAYDFMHNPALTQAEDIRDALGVSPAQAQLLEYIKEGSRLIHTLAEEAVGKIPVKHATGAAFDGLAKRMMNVNDPMATMATETLRAARLTAVSPKHYDTLEQAEKAHQFSLDKN